MRSMFWRAVLPTTCPRPTNYNCANFVNISQDKLPQHQVYPDSQKQVRGNMVGACFVKQLDKH